MYYGIKENDKTMKEIFLDRIKELEGIIQKNGDVRSLRNLISTLNINKRLLLSVYGLDYDKKHKTINS